jgi:ATP-dependent RNA helicase RhlE
MSAIEKLKLNKKVTAAMLDAGYFNPKELQSKILPRINGGQNVVAIGPEGCGKTTTYILASLNRIKVLEEIAPRILVLVPDIASGELVIEQYHQLNRNRDIRIMGLFAGPSLDAQVLELTDGVDIIVATPDRARAAYLKLGLNLNKIQMLIVDDADVIIKNGLQLPTVEIARGIIKGQFLVFSAVMHDRLSKMYDYFLVNPDIVEVHDLGDSKLQTIDQLLYHVPNFKTKLNLLNLLLSDIEVFEKAVVFVNSRFTAETVHKNLQLSRKGEVAVFKARGMVENSFETVSDFMTSPQSNILIIAQEDAENLTEIKAPNQIHFDIPEENDIYTRRVLIGNKEENEKLFITFCTDLELSQIRKLEQIQGKRMSVIELPEELYIETDKPKRKTTEE